RGRRTRRGEGSRGSRPRNGARGAWRGSTPARYRCWRGWGGEGRPSPNLVLDEDAVEMASRLEVLVRREHRGSWVGHLLLRRTAYGWWVAEHRNFSPRSRRNQVCHQTFGSRLLAAAPHPPPNRRSRADQA